MSAGGMGCRCRAGNWPRCTDSTTSTAAARMRGAMCRRCRTPADRRTPPATAEQASGVGGEGEFAGDGQAAGGGEVAQRLAGEPSGDLRAEPAADEEAGGERGHRPPGDRAEEGE